MGAGHEVLMAETADDAMAIARSRRPALSVVNLGLRADDPLALLGILKHDPDTRKAAVLAISSAAEREEALRAGADDVTVKPIEPLQLRDQSARLIAEAGRSRAYRVLTVDDDTTIRTICREVLTAAGYLVREAASGLGGLAEARRYKPDLILLDVMMPELDGFQTAEQLRADPATSMIPMIFLSARGETADKVRAFRLGAEDYVVKPFVSAELVARVGKALERRERELGASPTTQLPGANTIQDEIERRLAEDPGAAYCYLDLDNLKSFNDYYGYARADGVIRQTADLLRDVLATEGTGADFLGHIAGDDFVFITREESVDRICSTLCSAFDRLIPLYYNKVDRERGHIEAVDRFGVLRRFPLMSVSLAAVTAKGSELTSFAQLAESAAAGKKLAKTVEGSSYVRDRKIVVSTVVAPPEPPPLVVETANT
jgi:PleD family two-component response regulator